MNLAIHSDDPRISVFSAIAERWNAANISYGIINGYDDSTGMLGRDLDLLVCPADLQRSRDIALDVLRSSGWNVKFMCRPWAWWIFSFLDQPGGTIGFEIDLLPRLQSGLHCFQIGPSNETIPCERYGWSIDPRGTLIKTIVLQLVAGNYSKFPVVPRREALPIQQQKVLYRDSWLENLLAPLFELPQEKIDRLPHIRRAIKSSLRGHRSNPGPSLASNICFALTRFIGLNLLPHPAAPRIILISDSPLLGSPFADDLARLMRQASFLKPVFDDSNTGSFSAFDKAGTTDTISEISFKLLRFGWHLRQRINRQSVRLHPVLITSSPIHAGVGFGSALEKSVISWLINKTLGSIPVVVILLNPTATGSSDQSKSIDELRKFREVTIINASGRESPAEQLLKILICELFSLPEQ